MADAGTRSLWADALDPAAATDLAQAFKALGDPVRLQILSRITAAASGEICVCDLSPGFDLTGPTISHHLRLLREAGLIEGRRRGTWIYYRPRPERLAILSALLDANLARCRPSEERAAALPPSGDGGLVEMC